jgi:hypothetical protein
MVARRSAASRTEARVVLGSRNAFVLALAVGLLAASCGGNGDSAVATTSPADTTMSAPESESMPDGELFVDPEGPYEVVVNPEWVPSHGTLTVGVEVWAVEEPGPFTSNVNILTQLIPSGITLEDYLQVSIDGGDAAISNFALLEEGIVTGPEGQPLAFMTYEGSPNGQRLGFLGVFALRDEEAVVATFTAPLDEFDELRTEIEPYLLTLRPLP